MRPSQRSGAMASSRATGPSGWRTDPTTTTSAHAAMATSPPSHIHAGGTSAEGDAEGDPAHRHTVAALQPPGRRGGPADCSAMAPRPPNSNSHTRVSVPR